MTHKTDYYSAPSRRCGLFRQPYTRQVDDTQAYEALVASVLLAWRSAAETLNERLAAAAWAQRALGIDSARHQVALRNALASNGCITQQLATLLEPLLTPTPDPGAPLQLLCCFSRRYVCMYACTVVYSKDLSVGDDAVTDLVNK